MIVLSLNQCTLVLGAHTLFRGLNFEIQHDQRIGLIGANGAGKSSLFKMIVGEYVPEAGGSVVKARSLRLGYLPQEAALDPERSALELALEGNPRMAEVQRALQEVESALADESVYGSEKKLMAALERQQSLLEEYQQLGGDQYPKRVHDVLAGLGFLDEDLQKPLRLLSGGQKKLVELTRLLLAQPEVLLLDEPDNHLDLKAKNYLELLIQNYPGAVVIISHDRYLLDAVATHIAELENGRLNVFAGNYSDYILDKQLREARQNELYHVQQRQIARIETAIKRYSIWAKTYDNEKFAKRARAIQNRLDKMEKIERPAGERRRMELRLSGWRGSEKVLEFKHVTRGFGGRPILADASFTLYHGERVGVIGANGTGKSVLMRLALGKLQPDSGEIVQGPSILSAFFAQEHETLDPNQTLLQTVQQAGNLGESAAVAFLQKFLFEYRQCTLPVKSLSGGEHSRLQLALVMLSRANFLLLDEPTNHLDIASAEVLEETLEEFEGTALIISHDRYFLDQVVDRILTLENGRPVSHPGGYSDYLSSLMGS